MLAGWLWPGLRIWTTDVDRGLADAERRSLAAASGIDAEAIALASLAPIAARIFDGAAPRHGHWPWILTLGARGAKRSAGTQYCPACLGEDETPHYRVQWRLAWHTACEHHRTRLLERCAQCGEPLAPHRLEPDAGHIARCAACGADLRDASTMPCAEAALRLQRSADAVGNAGHGEWLGTPTSAAQWLAAAAFLARLARRAARSPTQGLDRLLAAAQCEAVGARSPGAGTSIERLGVEERAAVLDAVARLMALGDTGLTKAAASSGLTRQGWCERGDTVPGPLANVTGALPESASAGAKRPRRRRPRGPRPRHEVRQMMARLERTAKIGSR